MSRAVDTQPHNGTFDSTVVDLEGLHGNMLWASLSTIIVVLNCRYTLKEMTLVWHVYGGSDFQAARTKRSGVQKKTSFRHGESYTDERGR
jgi:predicted ABC-type sugar transport system permease subunit